MYLWTDFCHWAWWNNIANSLVGVTVIGGAIKLFLDNLFKNVPQAKSNTAAEFLYNVTGALVDTINKIKGGSDAKNNSGSSDAHS